MFAYAIKDRFADHPSDSSDSSEKDKKINLKIERDDLLIIDEMCEKYDVSRNALLNRLLERVFEDQVRKLGDIRLETLVLHRADSKVRWHGADIPWTYCHHFNVIHELIMHLMKTGTENGDSSYVRGLTQEELDRYDAVCRFFKKLDMEGQNK